MLLYAISMLMTTSVVAIIYTCHYNYIDIDYEKYNRLVFKMTRRILFLIGVFIVGLVLQVIQMRRLVIP